MRIILLRGTENSGKTSTLRLVYAQLYTCKDHETRKQFVEDNYNDFTCSFALAGKTIAFYTMGDYPEAINEAIISYADKCDILVCTSRYGKIYNTIRHTVDKYDKSAILIEKTNNAAFMRQANLFDAERVIETIYSTIKEMNEK